MIPLRVYHHTATFMTIQYKTFGMDVFTHNIVDGLELLAGLLHPVPYCQNCLCDKENCGCKEFLQQADSGLTLTFAPTCFEAKSKWASDLVKQLYDWAVEHHVQCTFEEGSP